VAGEDPSTDVVEPVDKRICVERRVENSRRLHFNHEGDWRPRLILWPEYDGDTKIEFPQLLDPATDRQWGKIVAGTIEEFTRELGQQVMAFRPVLPTWWERLSPSATPHWERDDTVRLDAEYASCRESYYGDHVFFIGSSESPDWIGGFVLDRTNLLPYGEAILDFGIEEAVMEISFSEHEGLFVETLKRVARNFDHEVEQTARHFISHWVIANRGRYDENWREF